MQNQPPATGRQWFRLASIARLESLRQLEAAPPPAPAPAPSPPPPIPPPVPYVALPPSPSPSPRSTNGAPPVNPRQPLPAAAPASSLPPVDAQTPQSRASTPTLPLPTPPTPPPPTPQSPRVIEQASADPLPESPKIQQRLLPIKAPTPRPEPEPTPTPTKTVFMQQLPQQGNNTPRVNNVKTIADINDNHPVSPRPPSPMKEASPPNRTGSSATSAWRKAEGGEMKIITMAGENLGAYMEIGKQQRQQRGHLMQHRLPNGSGSQGEDGKPDHKGKKPMAAAAKEKPMEALVNNNAQSINNSIIFRSSCTQQSPGVHMTLLSRRHPKHK